MATGWTTDDVTLLQDAIRDIAAGRRIVETTFVEKHHRYATATVTELQKLLNEIIAVVDSANTTKRVRVFHTTYSKGL